MDKLLELSDITLCPSPTNEGRFGSAANNYTVLDMTDNSGIVGTLPIFTSPIESVVGINSCELWIKNGIRPIIPRTESVENRLKWCVWIFSAFSLSELKRLFLDQDRRNLGPKIHIMVDGSNGHSIEIIGMCKCLRDKYGDQLIIMAGNVENPDAYGVYSEAGIDYMRVGRTTGAVLDRSKYGFHYPLASLLLKLQEFRNPDLHGKFSKCRPVKIIADGGIGSMSDVMKAMALGADYVMIGREFARIIEAEGLIYARSKNPTSGEFELNEVDKQDRYYESSGYEAACNGFCRSYRGGRKDKTASSWNWVDINISMKEWVDEFKNCVNYGFMMSNTKNWEDFKKNTIYVRS